MGVKNEAMSDKWDSVDDEPLECGTTIDLQKAGDLRNVIIVGDDVWADFASLVVEMHNDRKHDSRVSLRMIASIVVDV